MSESLSILMIDDNRADYEAVRRYLNDESVGSNLDLEHSFSTQEALETLSDQNYDVLIIDYHFPFGNGFDILRKIREEGFKLPSIMLTGEGNEAVAGKAVTENFSGYLPKDQLNTESLVKSIRQAVSDKEELPVQNQNFSSNKDSSNQNLLQPPGQFIKEISERSRKSKTGGIFLLNFIPRGKNITMEELQEIGEFLHAELEKLDRSDRIYQVQPNIIGGILNPGTSDNFSEKMESTITSLLKNAHADNSNKNQTLHKLSQIQVCWWNMDVEPTDPALIINKCLDQLLTSNETNNSSEINLIVEEINHG